MIVDDVGKVIGWETIGFDEYKVALVLVLLIMPVHQVCKRRAPFTAKPHDMALPVGGTAGGLIRGNASTSTGVVNEVTPFEGLLLMTLEVLSCAETSICMATV